MEFLNLHSKLPSHLKKLVATYYDKNKWEISFVNHIAKYYIFNKSIYADDLNYGITTRLGMWDSIYQVNLLCEFAISRKYYLSPIVRLSHLVGIKAAGYQNNKQYKEIDLIFKSFFHEADPIEFNKVFLLSRKCPSNKFIIWQDLYEYLSLPIGDSIQSETIYEFIKSKNFITEEHDSDGEDFDDD